MGPNRRIIVLTIAAVVMFGAGVLYYNSRRLDDALIQTDAAPSAAPSADETPGPAPSGAAAETPAPQKTVVVYISGEVRRPGIYEVAANSRVINVVEMAGGLTQDASDEVNLARVVTDGERIDIPKIGEAAPASADEPEPQSAAPTFPIDINTATKQQLMTLPGIGEVIADSIIRYRENNGGFKSKDEIKEVPRIGDKLYMELEELITAE